MSDTNPRRPGEPCGTARVGAARAQPQISTFACDRPGAGGGAEPRQRVLLVWSSGVAGRRDPLQCGRHHWAAGSDDAGTQAVPVRYRAGVAAGDDPARPDDRRDRTCQSAPSSKRLAHRPPARLVAAEDPAAASALRSVGAVASKMEALACVEAAAAAHSDKRMEPWFMDETRVGQKGRTGYGGGRAASRRAGCVIAVRLDLSLRHCSPGHRRRLRPPAARGLDRSDEPSLARFAATLCADARRSKMAIGRQSLRVSPLEIDCHALQGVRPR